MSEQTYVTILCNEVRQTEGALLIEQDGKESWIPKSMIKRKLSNPKQKAIEIDIPDWLAEDRGLYEE